MLDRVVWCAWYGALSALCGQCALCARPTQEHGAGWLLLDGSGWLELCGRVARGRMDLMEGKELGMLVLWAPTCVSVPWVHIGRSASAIPGMRNA